VRVDKERVTEISEEIKRKSKVIVLVFSMKIERSRRGMYECKT